MHLIVSQCRALHYTLQLSRGLMHLKILSNKLIHPCLLEGIEEVQPPLLLVLPKVHHSPHSLQPSNNSLFNSSSNNSSFNSSSNPSRPISQPRQAPQTIHLQSSTTCPTILQAVTTIHIRTLSSVPFNHRNNNPLSFIMRIVTV